jgi:FtsP/CotA-like multicopper oxidase with cupredoxin domain
LLLAFAGQGVVVWGEVCPPENTTCYYVFHVQHRLTLYAHPVENTCGSPGCYVESFANGSLVLGKNGEPMQHPETVITADGVHPGRLVTVAGPEEMQMLLPGTAIEVYDGQEIVVEVINEMMTDGVTIHWHGMHQRETPWMDGVQDITQCAIPPGVTMTYTFKADPGGTHWWHSHSGMQRDDGLFGALVVRPMPSKEEEKEKENIIDRHVLLINDWDPKNSASETFWYMMNKQSPLKPNLDPYLVRDAAGDFLEPYQTNLSFLVNGKGRHWNMEERSFNGAPLTTLEVSEGETHRVRVVNAGMTFPYRLSIDSHSLVLVASDGSELQPVEVESIIMWPGERYDFLVKLDQQPDAYWIRATSLVVGPYEDFVKPMGLCVLRYEGASREEPAGKPDDFQRPCSADSRCKVANCPFPKFHEDRHSDCLLFGNELVAAEGVEAPPAAALDEEGNVVEPTFLNFAFPGFNLSDASVNGQSLQLPGYAPLVSPEKRDWLTTCNQKCGANETCICPLTLEIKHDQIVDLVFTNIGSGAGWAHPVHTHGYDFYVLKSGFIDHLGEYFTNSGPQKDKSSPIMNPDIDCSLAGSQLINETWDHRPLCNNAQWANPGGPSLEGIDTNRSPLKDTIMVPAGGYVWVRFKADNPGLWFVHCHLSLHAEDGMALVLATGLEVLDEMKPIPQEYLNCKNLIS